MIKLLLISCLFAAIAQADEANGTIEEIITPIRFDEGDVDDIIIDGPKSRNAILGKYRRWPNGEIPYTYLSDNEYTDKQKKKIEKAMRSIEAKTCIRFVPQTTQTDYVTIRKHPDVLQCSSHIGRLGRQQFINLSHEEKKVWFLTIYTRTCLDHHTIVHELMHAIGLDHEHNRADRDQYVTINQTNVKQTSKHNFFEVNPSSYGNYGCPYTYESVMHYDKTAFAENKGVTMQPKDSKYTNIIGNVKDAHPNDYEKINRIYECKEIVNGHTCQAKTV